MSPILLCLLWSLVEVHSQTEFPYVSFMGENLPNNSYAVDLRDVGTTPSDSVQCHTNLSTCCSGTQGPTHRGDWYFPNGTRLQFSMDDGDIYEARGAQRVDLRRREQC